MFIRILGFIILVHLFFPSISHALELESNGSAGTARGPKENGEYVFDFEEELVKTKCNGSVRLSPCQSVSERFHDLTQYDLGACFQKAADSAFENPVEIKDLVVYGELYGTGKTPNGFWRLHNWRRAMDIYKVRINNNRTMVYLKAAKAWENEKTDNVDYIFWREFRGCWGSWGSRASVWFKDNSAHRDHIHISTPYTQPWSYLNGVAAK